VTPDEETLQVLKEIRDGQRAILAELGAQRALMQEQAQRYKSITDESVGLQREAVRRQRSITLVAVPAILACLAAIAYLSWRYL
jgi:hypothetical protein